MKIISLIDILRSACELECAQFMLHKPYSLHTSLHSISEYLTTECKEARNSLKLFIGLRAAETLHDYFCFDSLERCVCQAHFYYFHL